MPNLILIKHSAPQVVLGISPQDWVLSTEGQKRCPALARRLQPYQPSILYHSREAKAVETANLLASQLGIGHEPAGDLHEHDRSNVPHLRSSEFVSMMELLFRRPDELVLGLETATAALHRFEQSLSAILAKYPDQTIAVVSHGTVIALWLAAEPPKSNWTSAISAA